MAAVELNSGQIWTLLAIRYEFERKVHAKWTVLSIADRACGLRVSSGES